MRDESRPLRTDLHPALWLVLPAVAAAAILVCAAVSPELYAAVFRGELGAVELATPAMLVVGIAWALAAIRRPPSGARLAVRAWLTAFSIGALYFAGEELSWGQHLFGWATPESIASLNDQGETNLHNTSSWLDQKPKWVLRLGALLGGVLAPPLLALVPSARWSFWRWLWPTVVCMPAAALAVGSMLAGRLDPGSLPGGLGAALRISELEELWLAMFLMLYAGSLRARLPREAAPAHTGAAAASG